MITNPLHGLTFGPLNLIGTTAEYNTNGYTFEALPDTSFGNPVPITQKVMSWLQDGALLSKTGDDNRDDMSIRIRITGQDSNKLAKGEQALMLQTGIRNTLTWTPPDGAGEPCVFDVLMSSLDYDFDDINELHNERVYILRMQCYPFVRPENPASLTLTAASGTAVGTARQIRHSFGIKGSARTQTDLYLTPTSGTGNALGNVLVYVDYLGGTAADPCLRFAYLTSGNTQTTDSTTCSGKTSDLGTLHTFDIPQYTLQPGSFALMVRVKHATPGVKTVTWASKTRMSSTNYAGQSGTTNISVGSSFGIFEIAEVELPVRQTGSNGLARIELSGPPGLILDEAWLFNKDTGSLTWVDCGSGSSTPGGALSRDLWIEAADLDNPSPAVYVGDAHNKNDRVYASNLFSNDVHNMHPEFVFAFIVTTDSTSTSLTVSYYPRFHTHVVAP